MTKPVDRELLSQLAAQVDKGVILEIGSWRGASSRTLAESAKVTVYCIDMWDLTGKEWKRRTSHGDSSNYPLFLENTKGLDVVGIKGISAEIAKVWDKPIGLLFIDGNHTYEGCLADYEGFAHHVLPGGILAFHDYGLSAYGVTEVADEAWASQEWCDWQRARTTVYMRRK